MLSKLFFGYFAVIMVALSLLVITRRNPVHSVLWMLVLFFHIAGLYLFLNAEFLAAVQVILYAGAILVLFLFVIMMLNIKVEITAERFIGEWPIGVALGLSILMLIYFTTSKLIQGPAGQFSIEAIKAETHTKALGKVLYTEYLFPFEIASLILLIAIVGAIVLAKKRG
ncbi:MAG: NADH-quinone oxidoreductase subunit J [Thermodesulfovibrionales bacterium]|nr:NADH-quinone oxidoreductase subunit J [Thermodesulfovibrionales bacterium]